MKHNYLEILNSSVFSPHGSCASVYIDVRSSQGFYLKEQLKELFEAKFPAHAPSGPGTSTRDSHGRGSPPRRNRNDGSQQDLKVFYFSMLQRWP